VPAAVQMRHLAMAHALRAALPGDPLWEDALAATEGAVDVKEALKRTIVGRLEVSPSQRASYRLLTCRPCCSDDSRTGRFTLASVGMSSLMRACYDAVDSFVSRVPTRPC